MRNRFFPFLIASVLIIVSIDPNQIYAGEEKLLFYKNEYLNLLFQYPKDWAVETGDKSDCLEGGTIGVSCYILLKVTPSNTVRISIQVGKLDFFTSCKCNNLSDYANYIYYLNYNAVSPKILNQNDTSPNIVFPPAKQFEIMKQNSNSKSLIVATTYEDLGYLIDYSADSDMEYTTYLSEFQNLLKSILFVPFSHTVSEGEVGITSTNDFVDTLGFLHVVGEVINNTPLPANFVRVTGTFYDSNDEVVATQSTYTSPSDIPASDKAPFEIIVTSASIPISEIDHYRTVVGYQ